MNELLAVSFILIGIIAAYVNIGLPPVIIVGGSGIIGFLAWRRSYRFGPIPPEIILPPFLLTVAGLQVHMIEEYHMKFATEMSQLFHITWSEESFLIIFTFVGPILYTLTALGLFYRKPLAGFMAWFIFIGPGLAEFTHFIFPLLAHRSYFPGMYTAILPMIPGIYGIRAVYKYIDTIKVTV